MPNDFILEACVETIDQAIYAQRNGADRLEVCGDLSVGGITPDETLLKSIKASTQLPIMAMARPRGGNFVYNDHELDEIKNAIDLFKHLEIKGVVFGFLTKGKEVNIEITRALAAFAYPLEVTFHKAIDLTADPVAAARQISKIEGVQRILTSGGKMTAWEGKAIIKRMIGETEGQIKVIAAGKVTFNNLLQIHQAIGASEYHGRKIV